MRSAVIVVLTLGACTNFDFLPADVCGNGVVEPGEDCDVASGAPGASECVACRHRCNPDDPDELPCPDGWGCGRDAVCRHATGEYREVAAALDVEVSDFVIADLDGDPFADALGYGPAGAWVARGTPDLGFTLVELHALPGPAVRPVIGDIDGDFDLAGKHVPDVIFAPGSRAVAVRHSDDGHLAPAPQPWLGFSSCDVGVACPGAQTCTPLGCADACLPGEFPCPADFLCEDFPSLGPFCVPVQGPAVIVAAPVRTSSSTPFHDVITVTDDGTDLVVQIVRKGLATSAPLLVPRPVCDGPYLHAVADLDGDADDELLVGCVASSVIQLVGVTLDVDGAPQPTSLGSLTLPDALAGPILIANLDGGLVDVLATIRAAAAAIADFAVFAQTAPLVFGAATRDARLGDDVLLAAADLDADGTPDLVSDQGIFLARGAGLLLAAAATPPWQGALVGDVNRDGRLDVVARSSDRVEILAGGAGDLFARHLAIADGAVDGIAIGDVDGDRFVDVAVAWQSTIGDEVAIVYGSPDGLLDTLVPAGAIGGELLSIAIADFHRAGTNLGLDDIPELVVATQGELTVFAGGLSRPPLASLDPIVDPRALVLGHFDPEPAAFETTGLDLITLPLTGDVASVGYGGTSPRRSLGDQRSITIAPPVCPIVPAVVAAGDIFPGGTDELLELSCSQGADSTFLTIHTVGGTRDAPTVELARNTLTNVYGTPVLISVEDLDADLGPDEVQRFGDVITVHHDGDFLDVVDVYWNPGDPVLTPASTLQVAPLVGVTVGNIDDDLAVELVLGGSNQLAYDIVDTNFDLELVTQDLEPKRLDSGASWLVEAAGIPRLFDLDRDGVLDLILGGDTLRVFRAIPHDE